MVGLMKKWIASFAVGVGLMLVASPGQTGTVNRHYVCTCDEGSSIVLRTGAGSDFDRGLVLVGSGGPRISDYFSARNFTVPRGEAIEVFDVRNNAAGERWAKVGTNQWVAWVRGDFVCLFAPSSN
jgi:hypothetical protein